MHKVTLYRQDNFSYRAIRVKSMKTLHFLPVETIAMALLHVENCSIADIPLQY